MFPINPAVYAAAELFTDGAITPRVRADVAAMQGLPLYGDTTAPIPPRPVAPAPSALDIAEAEIARWTDAVTAARALYVDARAGIAHANRGFFSWGGGTRLQAMDRRSARRGAFRVLNRARATLSRPERALAAAVAPMTALRAPVALALAA